MIVCGRPCSSSVHRGSPDVARSSPRVGIPMLRLARYAYTTANNSRDSLWQRKRGKFRRSQFKLCDNLLAEEHRPPGIVRAPSHLRERQDIPCAAYDQCLRGARQTNRTQWEHCCFDPPVTDCKSFQLVNEEPLGKFLIYKYCSLTSTQVCSVSSSIFRTFHSFSPYGLVAGAAMRLSPPCTSSRANITLHPDLCGGHRIVAVWEYVPPNYQLAAEPW